MKLQYFDIHSHLYFPDFDSDRDRVILNMKEKGIYTTTIGTNLETSKKAVKLAEQNENLFASVGVHPAHFSEDLFDPEFENLVKHPKVVSIGECGFDYFRLEGDPEKARKIQTELFEKQIKLALENNKSLMLHSRPSKASMDAYLDTLDLLKRYKKEFGDKVFGNAHFFAGNLDILKEFLDIGFTVSFTGVITFTEDYNQLIEYTPIESIHTETDAPFVTPLPYRGKRNSPEYVIFVVEKLALIKNTDIEKLKQQLVLNAKKLFQISDIDI
jgi:TatD DNase family protein